jgi:hypothetical protein
VRNAVPTREPENIRVALIPLKRLYGSTLAADFGPLAWKTVRAELVGANLCRKTINERIGRVKRMFRCAVENELVPPSVFHGGCLRSQGCGRAERASGNPTRSNLCLKSTS